MRRSVELIIEPVKPVPSAAPRQPCEKLTTTTVLVLRPGVDVVSSRGRRCVDVPSTQRTSPLGRTYMRPVLILGGPRLGRVAVEKQCEMM